MHAHRITAPLDIDTFIHAGNARFTLVSKKTGDRFTFRVRASDDGKVFFASLLTGTDNENHYSYLGTIFADRQFRHGRKSKIAFDAPGAKAFAWFHSAIAQHATLPTSVEFWHEGACGRCNRTLTVPESIARGIGPDCWEQMHGTGNLFPQGVAA